MKKAILVLSFLGISVFSYSAEPTKTRFFLLGSGEIEFKSWVKNLQNQGAQIRESFPPKVIIVEALKTLSFQSVPGVKSQFNSFISIDLLQSEGPMVVAAARRWNTDFLETQSFQGLQTQGALRAMAAKNSNPPPKGLRVNLEESFLSIDWDPTLGTVLYEAELSKTSHFSNPFLTTYADRHPIQVSLPDEKYKGSLFIRIRGVDPQSVEGKIVAVTGDWSSSKSISVDLSALKMGSSTPTPYSPIDQYQSEGTTIILEWKKNPEEHTRIQVSKTESFKDTLIDVVLPGDQFSLPASALKIDETYFWRLQSRGKTTKSSFSPPRQFHINPPRMVGADMLMNPERPR